MKVLVTGGARSGKSFHAEFLLLAEQSVTYVAPGPSADPDDDPEWADRVAMHQARRPAHWTTVESADLASAINTASGAVLVDCLGTWLTTQIEEFDGWENIRDEWEPAFMARLDAVAEAIAQHQGTVVLVTNEVGMGVYPEYHSGRLFRDLLGIVNQRLALECDQVLLVVAGRILTL